jgi:phenylpyruvate tautomerase PptA (4-oxalocrotonate tautomerase family)
VPILAIRALPQPGADVGAVLAAVTRELAALLGEKPRDVWATWEEIPPGRFSEGGEAPATQPRGTHPPLVELAAFEGRPPELVPRMLELVAEVLARELRLEAGNVFVRYHEDLGGRLYSGGSIVGRDPSRIPTERDPARRA